MRKYIQDKDKPWKYEALAAAIHDILDEDEYNDTYGRIRMYQALRLKAPKEVHIPSENTVRNVMGKLGLIHAKRHKPNGITRAERAARKSDDLLKRDFTADSPLTKGVTDITEVKAKDGKLYVSAIFDCFDAAVLGLSMDSSMKASLCVQTLQNAVEAYPGFQGAILHSDRGSQYTSELYRNVMCQYGMIQSMNSDGGRCHDNARCESMWARMKEELFYGRYNPEKMTMAELKTLIWRYFIGYWNNRRICSANGGYPPARKRQLFYDSHKLSA